MTYSEWRQAMCKRGYRKDVLNFIADLLYNEDPYGPSMEIIHAFGSSYSLSFAKMLQSIFGGSIYWCQSTPEFFWSDDGVHFYFINGTYEPQSGEMLPVEFLGSMIPDILGTGKYHLARNHQRLVSWGKKNFPNLDQIDLVMAIFSRMPMHKEYHPGDVLEDLVYKFWKENPERCIGLVASVNH